MSFAIISTASPEYHSAIERFVPTWHANSGAEQINVYRLDGRTWADCILQRNEILHEQLSRRIGQRVLCLDIDCLVLRDLSGGFSSDHAFSVARWPHVQMGVLFVNMTREFPWQDWLDETLAEVKRAYLDRDARHVNRQCDTLAWQPRLHAIHREVCQLGEWEWNYSCKEVYQWQRDLPPLQSVTRILHLKGHGQWPQEKLRLAKRLWPAELAGLDIA